ncbi:MAG: nitroreductase family protein [Rhizobiaceae bacterium]
MNQNVIDFLLSRKSPPISVIHEPAPSDSELETMIRIASRVPDHGLLEPWRFIAYRGEARARVGEFLAKRIVELEGDVPEQRITQEKNRFTRAPLVVGVVSVPREHPRVPDWEKFISGGNAAFALVLAAHALGYAANWVSNWYADDAPSRAFMGLAPEERAIGFVHIGTIDAKVPDRPRPDPSKVLSDYSGPWQG